MEIKKIVKDTIHLLDKRKAEDIKGIYIENKSSVADYIVLASAANERQLGALADEVEEFLGRKDIIPKSIEGKKESSWVLMDYRDFIVNLLTMEMREKYNIEKIWAECETVDWE